MALPAAPSLRMTGTSKIFSWPRGKWVSRNASRMTFERNFQDFFVFDPPRKKLIRLWYCKLKGSNGSIIDKWFAILEFHFAGVIFQRLISVCSVRLAIHCMNKKRGNNNNNNNNNNKRNEKERKGKERTGKKRKEKKRKERTNEEIVRVCDAFPPQYHGEVNVNGNWNPLFHLWTGDLELFDCRQVLVFKTDETGVLEVPTNAPDTTRLGGLLGRIRLTKSRLQCFDGIIGFRSCLVIACNF